MTTLRQKFVMHVRLARGGYLRGYTILGGDEIVGSKTLRAESRDGPVKIIYHLGDIEFDNAKDFLAEYEWQKAAPAEKVTA